MTNLNAADFFGAGRLDPIAARRSLSSAIIYCLIFSRVFSLSDFALRGLVQLFFRSLSLTRLLLLRLGQLLKCFLEVLLFLWEIRRVIRAS